MFHLAYRGQPPAKGILHVEHRIPLRFVTDEKGNTVPVADPRGYFAGQHANAARAARRAAIKAAGGIRQFKKQRRAA